MPLSDKKKCQSLINEMGHKAEILQAGVARMKVLRQAYLDQEVDPTGTPLEDNVTAASDWIDALDALANGAVANGFIAAIVPTHTGNALED